jgi:hypothetical protein
MQSGSANPMVLLVTVCRDRIHRQQCELPLGRITSQFSDSFGNIMPRGSLKQAAFRNSVCCSWKTAGRFTSPKHHYWQSVSANGSLIQIEQWRTVLAPGVSFRQPPDTHVPPAMAPATPPSGPRCDATARSVRRPNPAQTHRSPATPFCRTLENRNTIRLPPRPHSRYR